MKRCWDQDPEKRPSSLELIDYFRTWKNEYRFNWHERVPVPENTSLQYHPKSCYTSRLINCSELNKIPSKTKNGHSRMPSHADCQLTQDILESLQDEYLRD
ncbi:unnamed protein product [Rhizophagus irregularis]|nr:unnamed protein product [Rhizophagus irregularis]